jgi:hypothetical protein
MLPGNAGQEIATRSTNDVNLTLFLPGTTSNIMKATLPDAAILDGMVRVKMTFHLITILIYSIQIANVS